MDTENSSNAPVRIEKDSPESDDRYSVISAEEGKEMKPPKKRIPWFRIFLIIIVVYLFYDISLRVKARKTKVEAPVEIVHPVKTALVKKLKGNFEVQYAGSTRAIRQVDIGFNVSGTLDKLPIKAGMMINKGDVIGELDPRDFQNDLNAAEANYNNVKAQLARIQKLYDAAVDPKSKLDEAVARFKVAEASLEIAQKARNDTVLKAPFKGIVAIRYVDNYQVVNQGQPIISLQDLGTLEIQADIPEWLVARSTNAENIEIYATYEAIPGVKIPLKIKEFSAEASSSTRTYSVRFYMQTNPTDSQVTILPGMTANITMIIKPKGGQKPSFLLPVWAVNSIGGKNKPSVFLVDESHSPWVVHEQQVDVAQMTEDSIVVEGDLKEGQRIVIAGATKLLDGMKVKDLPPFLKSNIAEKNESDSAKNDNMMKMLPEDVK